MRRRRLGRALRFNLIADRRGTTAVEMAFALPVLLTLLFGVVELGRVLYTSHLMLSAAREGVRYAMVRGAGSGNPVTAAQLTDYVLARAGSLDPESTTVAVSFTPNNTAGSVVEVDVSYSYNFLLPLPALSSVVLDQGAQTIIVR